MTIQMNIAAAKGRLSELVTRAEAGERVIIARDGKPAVELRPTTSETPDRSLLFGCWAHLGPMENPDIFFEDDPEIEAAMNASIFPDE